ncbi:glycosyltransferase family A protein [Brasilonema sp. UFV-L1]|uniref:glycosyltransferase family A protein n=1 Tax=Brasilonema sp. UFV-L1 TaxID=2234130 RepID=UPI00145FB8EA|nr:glycosyltransferase family A protein [Brasilonema sp. UFV-L1]NMG05372.1 glycosyltransferase family 2 protein [Brasilonema sp. UFV-L1]
MKTKVTIAIPTYNRSNLLKINLKSLLAQDYPDFQVLVLDNASTDDTESVIRSFADPRVTYVRNKTNIGAYRNFCQAIKLNSSDYLVLLPDDDPMLPGLIHESVLALDTYPNAAFSVTGVQGIDEYDNPVLLPEDSPPVGLISGVEYLHQIVAGRNWVIHASSVMIRSSALKAVGGLDVPHSKHSNDINLYLRMAAQYDIVFIPKPLSQVRIHAEQDGYIRFHTPGGTGPLATMAERTDAIAHLLQSPRAADAMYRRWLTERLLHISMRRSEITSQHIPNLNLSWEERLQIALQDIATSIPADKTVILVDEDQWGFQILSEFRTLPFVERNGQYWGAPSDDKTAISELERMRYCGADYIVFGWPAFWWFDYYSELRNYLSCTFHCILHNSRVIIFDLRQPLEVCSR